MLTLVNTNRMTPPIAPIGLDYVAGAARRMGVDVEVLDLSLADDADAALRGYFGSCEPELIGLSFRNLDDSFWPSCQWFVPQLAQMVERIRSLSGAPICLGGTGFSIFARRVLELSGADFGIRGDGEAALPALLCELRGERRLHRVAGLLWRQGQTMQENPPAWPEPLRLPTRRDRIDNATYFHLGGQIGLETKRGCPVRCIFCADPLAKGCVSRLRDPREVADEIESLLGQGVDVLHTCDAEFNIPIAHARAVCEEIVRRGLGRRIRWYAYLAVVPFDAELARAMARAGCVGVNFTAPAATDVMLAAYQQPHTCDDLAVAVRLCKEQGIAVMIDLMLGGPGETPATVSRAIATCKRLAPDCVGTGVGVRLHPDLPMIDVVRSEGPLETNPAIHRKYGGSVDLIQPTFYISASLGERPAQLVRDAIAGDSRFFPPSDDAPPGHADGDHNYNDNTSLTAAIAAGARGAYWDILRGL